MIERAQPRQIGEIREIWQTCFPMEDPRYIDFYLREKFRPENAWCGIIDGRIAAVVLRKPHAMMFNGRVLRVSMISGVATLPQYRRGGLMKELLAGVLDACEHTELITLLRSEQPALYEPHGFRKVYRRREYTLTRQDVKRIPNYGLAYEPAPIDMLKVYSAFIRRFNGFYARDLADFINYRKEIRETGGKVVAYYDETNRIRGYAVMRPEGETLAVEEIVYLDGLTLLKLANAALQEKKTIRLNVSAAEHLTRLFPKAPHKEACSIMARLNDAELFSRLFNRNVTTVEEAYALSARSLNLNEYD